VYLLTPVLLLCDNQYLQRDNRSRRVVPRDRVFASSRVLMKAKRRVMVHCPQSGAHRDYGILQISSGVMRNMQIWGRDSGCDLRSAGGDILAAESFDSMHRAGKIFATQIDQKKNEIYYLF